MSNAPSSSLNGARHDAKALAERAKALDMALGQIDKQFGQGAIMRMGDKATLGIDVVPTGALALDIALGVGGLPRGRITEIYGPESSGKSTLAMHVVSEAQRNGGVCAYIDAEHAMDPIYAKAIGVDVDQLLISQPDTGEQALEIADMLVRSGAIDVVVIDSVAALTPKAEIEGDMGDTHVGLQARLMSQALRKLTGSLNKTNTIMIFINQLREKIGIMFGCFDHDTQVTLADGGRAKIGTIVKNKLPVEVLSYDFERGELVAKPVTNWFDNGPASRFLEFKVAKAGKGRASFAVTENHLISTPGGWRPAGELEVGDRVMQSVPHHLSDQQWQIILGGLMGDGALSPTRNGSSARFRWGHGAKQADYGDWKASLFANLTVSRSTNAKGAVFHDVQPLAELAELRSAVYIGGRKVLSDDYLKLLTPLSLAVWYMDDGTFAVRAKGLQERTRDGSGRSEICVEAFDTASRVRLQRYLADSWGINARLTYKGDRQMAFFIFAKDESAKLHALVAPFIHPSMQYKLLPKYQGRFSVEPVFAPVRDELMPMPITKIAIKPPTRSMHRFDLEVGGTHNYFADGVMVHNSPETTPGGRALKFYSSVRLDIRRIESLKDGAEVVGNRTRVKVVKNKCVASGTMVFDPSSGLTRPIEEIVGGAAHSVVAADKAGVLHARPITQRFDQGEAEVITLALRDGTTLRVTPDHRIMTDGGWKEAGELLAGDRVARPRQWLPFGNEEPISPDEARLLGYLIGDGCVTGKTPVSFINIHESLHADAARIASGLGCNAHRRSDLEVSFSHRPGERNQVLDLVRWAGVWGKMAPEKTLPAAFFTAGISEEVAANLVFGLLESDGYVTREQTGAIRVGYTTTSRQLAEQLHWLLLRWGIGSSVRSYDPTTKRPSIINGRRVQGKHPSWELRMSGIENVARFAEVIPMWGPRGTALVTALADPTLAKHRGSQRNYLSRDLIEPVLEYLRGRGITPQWVAALVGEGAGDPRGGLRQVLGHSRLRRDRVQLLADALESPFLYDVLADGVWYDKVMSISEPEWADVYDIEVDEHHTFVANDIVVSNCAAPFKQAEFDIMYGKGISREGSTLDMAVELGIVKKSGAWFTYEGEQLGQGRENAKSFLIATPEIMVDISDKVLTMSGLKESDEIAETVAETFTEADEQPIDLG